MKVKIEEGIETCVKCVLFYIFYVGLCVYNANVSATAESDRK